MGKITKIVVLGAKGRMGQMILTSISTNPFAEVVGAIEKKGNPCIGQVTGIEAISCKVTDNLEAVLAEGVVVIDFTHPTATLANLPLVVKKKACLVIGTTGFSDVEKLQIKEASKSIAIVMSPNMSLGVNVLFKITEMVAKTLGTDFDTEIIEAHHKHKKDSPSGTAFGIAEAVARGHGVQLKDVANYGREGMVGERPKGEIGIHAVRGGDIVGDHTVLYAGEGERIELKHVAHSRSTFANGAVKAAIYLNAQKPGLYNMFDVLGLN